MTMCARRACSSGAFTKLQSVESSTIASAWAAIAWFTPCTYSAGFDLPSKVVTFQPTTFAAVCVDCAGSEQPTSVWSQETIQILSPRFHFGADFGLPLASDAFASCASRAFACVMMFPPAAGDMATTTSAESAQATV